MPVRRTGAYRHKKALIMPIILGMVMLRLFSYLPMDDVRLSSRGAGEIIAVDS